VSGACEKYFLQLVENIQLADPEVPRRYRHFSQSVAVDQSGFIHFLLPSKYLYLFYSSFWVIHSGLFPFALSYHSNLGLTPPLVFTTRPDYLNDGNSVFSSSGYIPHFFLIVIISDPVTFLFTLYFPYVPHFRDLQTTVNFVGQIHESHPHEFTRTP